MCSLFYPVPCIYAQGSVFYFPVGNVKKQSYMMTGAFFFLLTGPSEGEKYQEKNPQ